MIATGWKEDGADLIWWADPSRDDPTYLVDAAECRHLFTLGQGVGGFTSPVLSEQLREVIGRAWMGPGFAAVVDPSRFASSTELIAAALHEFCHGVLFSAGIDLVGPPGRKPAHPPYLISFRPAEGPPWLYHGWPFLRIACHVAHRVKFRSPIDTWDLVQEVYDLANVLAYQAALGKEPQRRYREPLAAIAASDPPAEFREFAEWDLHRARKALDRTPPIGPGHPRGSYPGGGGARGP